MAVQDHPSHSPVILLVVLVVAPNVFANIPRFNWNNPCGRHRPSREARTPKSLITEIDLAVKDYREINKTIAITYNHRIDLFDKEQMSPKNLPRFFDEFGYFGRKIVHAMKMKVNTMDSVFSTENRTAILTKLCFRTKSLMCEIEETLRHRDKLFKVSRKPKTQFQKIVIKKNANLTDTVAIDSVLYNTYWKLLEALRKHMRRNRRKKKVHKMKIQGKQREENNKHRNRKRRKNRVRKQEIKSA